MPVLKYDNTALRVNIADKAQLYIGDASQESRLFEGKLTTVQWHDHKTGPRNTSEEFIATPIDILHLPDGMRFNKSIASDYQSHDWYFVERNPNARGLGNQYVVHADDLIPLNAEYPTIMSTDLIKHLQEMLALAQLEAILFSHKPEVRLGPADRLLARLRGIAGNVSNLKGHHDLT